MADKSAFSVRFIINPLILLYQRVFPPSTTAPPTSAFESQWAIWFYGFLNFLCFSHDLFNSTMAQIATYLGAQIEPKYTPSFSSPKTFATCPTLLLRAIVPSSGFTVTFRALFDSGAYRSFIDHDLATLLFNNGATPEYIWPVITRKPFYKVKTLNYRKIIGLTLQSVEDTSVNITTSILVDEYCTNIAEYLPVDLVVKKMASFGLSMVESGELGRTMWSEDEPNSQYRVDMLIGQDLLNAHFNIHPIQPTYHITPSLAIFRTKMGIAFLGQFDTDKFKQWTLSTAEVQKMKEALYPNNTDEFDISATQKEEINNILTFDVSDTKKSWKEYADAFCCTFNFVFSSGLSLLFCFFAFVFKFFLFVTFLHRLTFFNFVYTHYLSFTSIVVLDATRLYKLSIFQPRSQWLNGNSSICSNLMPYCLPSRLAVTVKSDTCTKTVWAYIDTGAASSVISNKLAKELNAEPSEVIVSANNENRKFVNLEIGKPNDNQFTKIKLKLTSVNLFSSKCAKRKQAKNKKAHTLFSPFARIVTLLNIPFGVPEETTGLLLIGSNLIPSLLYPSPSRPNRCISLASNLNLIETRLGYYFQGTQFNSDIDFCYNWTYFSLTYYSDQHFSKNTCLKITVLILTTIAILLIWFY